VITKREQKKKKAFSSHLLFSRDVEPTLPGSRTRSRCGHAGHVWQREHHLFRVVFARGGKKRRLFEFCLFLPLKERSFVAYF
jgi:hypothetical protein